MKKNKKLCEFCKNEISEDAIVCPSCGVKVGTPVGVPVYNTYTKEPSNDLAIVGFVLSIIGLFTCIFSIAGLIVSIIAYRNRENYVNENKGFAIAGLVISIVVMGIAVLGAILSILIPTFITIILAAIGLAA